MAGWSKLKKKIDFFELCNSSLLKETLQNFAFYKYPKKWRFKSNILTLKNLLEEGCEAP